jgi:hypothetical protein
MAQTTLTAKSVRIAEDEAKWLSTAATKGAVTQNDLIRLALHRLRKDLGAANRLKPETVLAHAKASKYKLTPPRIAGAAAPSAAKAPSRASRNGKATPAAKATPAKATPAKAAPRRRAKRARAA